MMRRIVLLVTVALVMAVMLVSSALPALAAPPAPPPSGGVYVLCGGSGAEPGPYHDVTPPYFVVAPTAPPQVCFG